MNRCKRCTRLGVILLVGIRRWNKRFGELYDKMLEEWDNE